MDAHESLMEPEDTLLYIADARRARVRHPGLSVTERFTGHFTAALEEDTFQTHVRLNQLVGLSIAACVRDVVSRP